MRTPVRRSRRLRPAAVTLAFATLLVFAWSWRRAPSDSARANDDAVVARFAEKLEFRETALSARGSNRVDEVVYILTTPVEGPHCTAALIREAIRSAATLRAKCVRCDFDIVVAADAEIALFLTQNANATANVFDDVRVVPSANALAKPHPGVFASNKPSALLAVSRRSFVLFLDADVYSDHRSFPESLFDLLHKDMDLVLPYDWAHRHGAAYGRGVPGLCTCLIGFLNAPAVRRAFELWNDELVHFSDPAYVEARKALGVFGDADPLHSSEQPRDQELLSVAWHRHRLPDVSLFTLTPEWMCPAVDRPGGFWVDAFATTAGGDAQALSRNPCKAFHSHAFGQGNKPVGWGPASLWRWLHTLDKVDPAGSWARGERVVVPREKNHCGGYRSHQLGHAEGK